MVVDQYLHYTRYIYSVSQLGNATDETNTITALFQFQSYGGNRQKGKRVELDISPIVNDFREFFGKIILSIFEKICKAQK